MAKQRIGRGPLDVALQDTPTSHPRLYVRDGNGLVVVLPVPPRSLPAVRVHLDRSGPGRECDVELVDDRGEVASRWGVFTDPGAAAALAAVLIGTDRDLVGARVVAPAGGPATAR
ncbi:hypothetical protein FHR75_000499 [Kineococcus radiotolerans]|uniref:Uncharacterized protein n=1 Tax=Kineococcus radiotolerans TaxID=131568 RepID=A0A7W4TK15_KINRA|nr:hypothetical protein [Kineococcus radiotolerans]MBB2899711.1 hypothetical protein [Kineococcus radiotolerans]